MRVYIHKIHILLARDAYVIADGPQEIGFKPEQSKTMGPSFNHCADADGFARNVLGATEVVPTWKTDA